jgi:hypothetical protein
MFYVACAATVVAVLFLGLRSESYTLPIVQPPGKIAVGRMSDEAMDPRLIRAKICRHLHLAAC